MIGYGYEEKLTTFRGGSTPLKWNTARRVVHGGWRVVRIKRAVYDFSIEA